MIRSFVPILWAALGLLSPATAHAKTATTAEPKQPLSFRITFDPAVQSVPYSGRVYVVASQDLQYEPRQRINNWFAPPQVFAVDVKNIKPAESVIVDGRTLAHPAKMEELPVGTYRIQAIARRSLDHPVPGQGPGDLHSTSQTVVLDPSSTGAIELRLSSVVAALPFEQSDRVKLVEMVSPSLSKFHGREITLRASVLLPAGFKDDPSTRYPVLYFIPGFGGDHHMVRWFAQSRPPDHPGHDVLLVVPDPTCYRGHSVFADSDNNGPWGKALTEELIPRVEAKFRGAGSGRHRYVTGVSSGGWSALWLQITYPDVFNGCWAHAPDPVDFRALQTVDLYASGVNMYVDEEGQRRPTAHRGDRIMLYCDDFVRMEEVHGPGGQIHSLEAVFCPRGADGQPRPLFDRKTGRVDPEVARACQSYDIRMVLERNWSTLGPKLAGKLHVYAGGRDNFYLDRAVRLLEESLEKLGSDAEVLIDPEMGHGLYRPAVQPMYRAIVDNYKRSPDP